MHFRDGKAVKVRACESLFRSKKNETQILFLDLDSAAVKQAMEFTIGQ